MGDRDLEAFHVGERVHHPAFGFGAVSKDEKSRIVEVVFDGREPRLVSLKFHALVRVSAEEESAMQKQDARRCLETFVFEPELEDHPSATRMLPFVVPAMVEKTWEDTWRNGRYAYALSDFEIHRPPPWPFHFRLPRGEKRRWPELQDALHFACQQHLDISEDYEMFAPFPVVGRGTQMTLRIDKVMVWGGGIEAQIEATWKGAIRLTFFDTDFAVNARWYRAGESAEFVLCAVAYVCGRAHLSQFELPDDHFMVQTAREFAPKLGLEPSEVSNRFTLEGAALLLPSTHVGADRDDYMFRGVVTEAIAYEMLGQPGWLLNVRVLRTPFGPDAELDLRVLVTQRAWKEDTPPQIGDDVGGILWLQGRLWSPPERST